VFIDVCPVIQLPIFVRPLGLVAAWTAGRTSDAADRWDVAVRTNLLDVLPNTIPELDDELLFSLTSLAVACDGTLTLPMGDACRRFEWLKEAYKI
jgi:hypothetical protein